MTARAVTDPSVGEIATVRMMSARDEELETEKDRPVELLAHRAVVVVV